MGNEKFNVGDCFINLLVWGFKGGFLEELTFFS